MPSSWVTEHTFVSPGICRLPFAVCRFSASILTRRLTTVRLVLEVLGTFKSNQKQGRGKALVQWGTALADQLGLECYLDASLVGAPLYRANGYVKRDVSDVVVARSIYSMVRPATTQEPGSS